MTLLQAFRDSSGQLYRLRACGHAGAGEKGQDIICAAVSVLLQTLQAGLVEQLGIELNIDECDSEQAIMDFSWTPISEQSPLTESVLSSLAKIARQEPDYLTYSEVE